MAAKKESKGKTKTPGKVSKGNIFNFIEDTSKDKELQNLMTAMIKKKGKGEKPETLLEEFLRLGYDGVSLRDCKKILDILKGVDPSAWDWSY